MPLFRVSKESIYTCSIAALHKKVKFSIKDFFSKYDQNLRIWSHLLKKSFMENFIFYAVHQKRKQIQHN